MKKYVLLLFYILFTSALYAVDSNPAILAKGPLAHKGIEFLGVNVLESQYGEYRYGEDVIIVYYTTEDIFLSDKWTSLDCSGVEAVQMNLNDEQRIVSFTDKKGWTAFLSFSIEAEYVCSFLEVYQRRQNYFLNIARDKTVFSFPAVLEF